MKRDILVYKFDALINLRGLPIAKELNVDVFRVFATDSNARQDLKVAIFSTINYNTFGFLQILK